MSGHQGDAPGDACLPQEGLKEAMEKAKQLAELFKAEMCVALDPDLREFIESPHMNITNVLLLQLCRNTRRGAGVVPCQEQPE